MQQWTRVARAEEIPVGQLKGFEIGFNRFVVAHTADGFYAVDDECTHESKPLSNGRIHGREIMCTAHGARFDLGSGAVTAPPAVVPLNTLTVKVENDEIFVLLDD